MSDETLIVPADRLFRTSLRLETLWAGLGQRPLRTLTTLLRNGFRLGKTESELAGQVTQRYDLMPADPMLRAALETAHATGRPIMFAGNLSRAQLRALAAAYGATFDPGATPTDLQESPAERRGLKPLVKAMRPHQWVKNILLVLPLLAAHEFQPWPWLMVLLGILAFSAAASAIYIVNDLLDLEADRLHATKHRRPFASGAASIGWGMALAFVLAVLALGIAVEIGATFLLVVLVYMALSLAYSLKLKRVRWLDILMLAGLYTIRVVGGAAAAAVATSTYMLIFVFPVFVALGAVKRLTELTLAKSDERLPGRGYSRIDRRRLLSLAIVAITAALAMFWAYTNSEQAQALYPQPLFLQLALIPIAWWLIRMVRLGYLGKQDYDPIIFAMKDRRGLGLVMLTLSMMFWGAGLWQRWFDVLF